MLGEKPSLRFHSVGSMGLPATSFGMLAQIEVDAAAGVGGGVGDREPVVREREQARPRVELVARPVQVEVDIDRQGLVRVPDAHLDELVVPRVGVGRGGMAVVGVVVVLMGGGGHRPGEEEDGDGGDEDAAAAAEAGRARGGRP